jgi:hypothetical protein
VRAGIAETMEAISVYERHKRRKVMLLYRVDAC